MEFLLEDNGKMHFSSKDSDKKTKNVTKVGDLNAKNSSPRCDLHNESAHISNIRSTLRYAIEPRYKECHFNVFFNFIHVMHCVAIWQHCKISFYSLFRLRYNI